MSELDHIKTWELPNSWCYAKLEDIGCGENAIVDGPFGSNLKVSDYVEDSINGVPVLTTKNLEGDYSKGSVRYISQKKYEELKRSKVQPGDILVAKIGSIGKTGIYPVGMKTAIIPANLLKFTVTSSVELKYVFSYLNCLGFQQYIKLISTATAQPAFNVTKFRKLPIPLPPKTEQHRIVAKIEELFSELDKGIENLKTARAQLKVYRQALLKHAFEGRLTAQWRAENQSKLETADALLKRIQQERAQRYQQQLADWEAAGKQGSKPKAPKPLPPLTAEELAELPELPKGWGWVRPEEICVQESYAIGIGPFGSNLKVSDYRASGIPLIFVKNITRSNFSRDLKHIDEAKYKELLPHAVKALDLLITKMGDPPGDCEIYPADSPDAVLTADCLKFRLWEEFANRKLYKFCINSMFVKRQLGLITKGVAQKKISVERFKTICLPLFCVEEQKVLIQEIESKLSEADQLDQTITTSLQQVEALRQSILKKTFSGQLVPQDPHDEPASALLARIQAERADVAMKPRKTAKDNA